MYYARVMGLYDSKVHGPFATPEEAKAVPRAMVFTMVPISEIKLGDWHLRPSMVPSPELITSIHKEGIRQPLECVNGVLADGYLRLAAAKSLGLTEVPVRYTGE